MDAQVWTTLDGQAKKAYSKTTKHSPQLRITEYSERRVIYLTPNNNQGSSKSNLQAEQT